jgi:hypothetical protein
MVDDRIRPHLQRGVYKKKQYPKIQQSNTSIRYEAMNDLMKNKKKVQVPKSRNVKSSSRVVVIFTKTTNGTLQKRLHSHITFYRANNLISLHITFIIRLGSPAIELITAKLHKLQNTRARAGNSKMVSTTD